MSEPAWIPLGGGPPISYGVSLPANPVDGQEAVLVDSITSPTYFWRFRYNAASTSAYKWEFMGGQPQCQTLAASISWTGNWSNVSLAGPAVVVPRIGEYKVLFGARIDRVADTWAEMAVGVGGAGPPSSDNTLTVGLSAGTPYTAPARSHWPIIVSTDTPAGRELRLWYQTGGAQANFMRRWMEATPVRVS